MKSSKKLPIVAVMSVLAAGSLSAGLVACGDSTTGDEIVGYINAPATLEAELGTYVSPRYDVVNANGLILAGYTVRLKSVKDASGNDVEVISNSVLVENAGVYKFNYTANSSGVKDVTVNIDFADRTAPTVNLDDSNLPVFFINGNTYALPSYTLSGDYDRTKCYAKVFYIDTANKENEVPLDENDRFKVDKAEGSYEIRIHVEDSAGNYNDYKYMRAVDGPEHFVENKVVYFDEAFGERQISLYEPTKYKGEFVEGGEHVYSGDDFTDTGAYKLMFDGVTETLNNEACISITAPAVVDISKHENFYMYIYNDSDSDVIVGSQWWNDTTCKAHQWTKVTWSTRLWGTGELGTGSGNVTADNRKPIGMTNITGQTIRFVWDYKHQVIPNGTFYLSSMMATPKEEANVVAADGDSHIIFDLDHYYVNDTVYLDAAYRDGMSVDCYTVNGEPIMGNSFVVKDTSEYKVGVRYVPGDLTKDNMTWCNLSGVQNSDYVHADTADNVYTYKLGEGDQWVISYDIYGVDQNSYVGIYVGGVMKLIGFELNPGLANGVKFASYGYPWGDYDGSSIPPFNPGGVADIFKGATQEKPVTLTYVRDEAMIKVFLTFYEDGSDSPKTIYVTTVDHGALGVDDSFGLGQRRTDTFKEFNTANVKGVSGADKVELFMAQFKATLKLENVIASECTLGDWVSLTAAPAPEGQIFSHFTVDGNPIKGNSFTVTSTEHTVKAVYITRGELTLKDGVTAVDGQYYGVGTTVTLRSDPTAGVLNYFEVDGVRIVGDTFVTTTASHVITAKYITDGDVNKIAWNTVGSYELVGGDAMHSAAIGNGTNWVMTYTTTTENMNYLAAYVGGSDQLLGVEVNKDAETIRKFGGYGGIWKGQAPADTPSTSLEVRNALISASESNPVKAIYVRNYDDLYMFLELKDGTVLLVGTAKFSTFGVTGNDFGLGGRNMGTWGTQAEYKNIQYFIGDGKVELFNSYIKTLGVISVEQPETQFVTNGVGKVTLPTATITDVFGKSKTGKVTISSVVDQAGKSYTVTDNAVNINYKGATTLTVTYSANGCPDKKVDVLVQDSDGTVLTASEAGAKMLVANQATIEYSTEQHYGEESGSIKITPTADLGSYPEYAFLNFDFADYDYIEFYAYTALTDHMIGAYWYGDTLLQPNTWTRIRLELKNDNIKNGKWVYRLINFKTDETVYLSSAKLVKADYSKAVVDLSKGTQNTQYGSAVGTWDTTKKFVADPSDADAAKVDTSGSLKIEVDDNEYAIAGVSAGVNADDLSYAKKVYFYVYTDADNAEGVVGAGKAQAGSHWFGDTGIKKGEWTKIEFTAELIADKGKGFLKNPVDFKFRLMNCSGKTVYITSLYAEHA